MQESDIFRVARRLEGLAFAEYLNDACGTDVDLRSDVEALLEVHHRQQGSTFKVSSGAQETQTVPMQTLFAERYRLRELIGHGGMGLVYLADQQEPIQRQVAIKIIKSSHASQAILTRFDQERQALALMDHPHIAKVYDAGVTRLAPATPLMEVVAVATPYLVMEYLQGIPISKYCEKHQLDVRERVALFIPVCQAIQHAHQKGIIHRDMKPSNILVVEQDGKPVAKVIDFGIAKAIEHKLTELSIQTEAGAIVGTLEYMSPEQARLNNQDVDSRTDIYSLGVILYELVSGVLPFSREEFSQCGLSDALEIIQRREPRKPSSRLSEVGNSKIQDRSRLTGWRKTQQQIQGDLDWIVMKCLEKDRQHRYESAGQLSQELERYLAHEPVQAGPPSWTYRWGKLMRKHRGKLVAASLIGMALFAGLIASATGWQHAVVAETLAKQEAWEAKEARRREHDLRLEVEKQRDLVQDEKSIAQAVTQFLQKKLLTQGDYRLQVNSLLRQYGDADSAEYNPRISKLLQRAEDELTPENIEKNFPKQPLVQAALLKTVGETYMNAGVIARTPAILERALALYEVHRGAEEQETLIVKNSLGIALLNCGDYNRARQTLEEVYEAKSRVLGSVHADTLVAANNLAQAWSHDGNYLKARKLLTETINKRTERLGPDHSDTLLSQSNQGYLLVRLGKTAEAIQILEATRDKQIKLFGKDHPDTLISQHRLADAYSNAGKYQEAAKLLEYVHQQRKARLGEQHPRTLASGESLGAAYCFLGRLSESQALLESIRDQYLAIMPDDHPDVMSACNYLAMTYREQQKYPQALALFQHVEQQLLQRYGSNFYLMDAVRNNTASTYFSMGRHPEAIELFLQVIDNRKKTLGMDHDSTLKALSNLGAAYTRHGQYAKALTILQDVVERRGKLLGLSHPLTLTSQFNLAVCYFRLKNYDQALAQMEFVHEQRVQQLGATHLDSLKALDHLGKMNWTIKRLEKSVPYYENLNKLYAELKKADPAAVLQAKADLGVNYKDAQRYQEAVPLLATAFATVTKYPDLYYSGPALVECYLQLKEQVKAQATLQQVIEHLKRHHNQAPERLRSALQALSKRLEKHDVPVVKDTIGKELAALK